MKILQLALYRDFDREPPITVIPGSQPEYDDWPEPLTVISDSEDNESVRIYSAT